MQKTYPNFPPVHFGKRPTIKMLGEWNLTSNKDDVSQKHTVRQTNQLWSARFIYMTGTSYLNQPTPEPMFRICSSKSYMKNKQLGKIRNGGCMMDTECFWMRENNILVSFPRLKLKLPKNNFQANDGDQVFLRKGGKHLNFIWGRKLLTTKTKIQIDIRWSQMIWLGIIWAFVNTLINQILIVLCIENTYCTKI